MSYEQQLAWTASEVTSAHTIRPRGRDRAGIGSLRLRAGSNPQQSLSPSASTVSHWRASQSTVMNGLRPRRDTTTTPTERTPLLADSSHTTTPQDASTSSLPDGRPHIGSFVAEVRPEDLRKYTLDSLYPPTLRSRSAQTAFSLCALLYFRTYLCEGSPRGRDIWAQWRQEHRNVTAVHDADALIAQVWEYFLEEEGSSEDVREVLWSEFPLYPDSRRTVRGERNSIRDVCSLPKRLS